MDIRRQAGQRGETVAASFLEKEGIRILMKNFRCKYGEIDLIAKDQNVFLIVEVKMRSTNRQGFACEAVDWRKQRKICRTYRDKPCDANILPLKKGGASDNTALKTLCL